MIDMQNFIAEREKNAIPDSEIDTSDIPELTQKDFDNGYFKYYKPRKKQISIRLDIDILNWLRKNRKWQTKINDILRKAKYQETVSTTISTPTT